MVKTQNEKESCNSFNNAIYPNLKRVQIKPNIESSIDFTLNDNVILKLCSAHTVIKMTRKKVQNFNQDMQVIKVKST